MSNETKARFKIIGNEIQWEFTDGDTFKKINNVLPLALQNRITHLRDKYDRVQWVIGDLFNEIYTYVKANGIEATRSDVANYLLYSLGIEDERSYSSILIDGATSAFYPVEERRKYSVLPFSHYRFAATFGEDATTALETAMNFFEQYGRPPSVKWLKNQFRFNLQELAAIASDPNHPMMNDALASKTGTFGPGPDYVPEPTGGPVDRVRYHVDALRSAVISLPGERAKLIAQIVVLCEQVLETL